MLYQSWSNLETGWGSLIEVIINCDKGVVVRCEGIIWYCRADREHPRRDQLERGAELIGEGVVQPTG